MSMRADKLGPGASNVYFTMWSLPNGINYTNCFSSSFSMEGKTGVLACLWAQTSGRVYSVLLLGLAVCGDDLLLATLFAYWLIDVPATFAETVLRPARSVR
ncbi:hypothetical protein M404DRAFT_999310 [Pisolithus tinctorius Marx 270]|uniref:Uncharacterized protein n=1 Tax=Pisolithus tinctorius Marx 270 TaxID=870435 RepID=A0A0C3PE45_PISTI|nr:hypothetical protein M404DRAFT_999310 [Pisolithus tinctorius Marx 270]